MRKANTINSEDGTDTGDPGWRPQSQRCHGKAPEALEPRSEGRGAIRTRDQGIGFNRTGMWRPGRV